MARGLPAPDKENFAEMKIPIDKMGNYGYNTEKTKGVSPVKCERMSMLCCRLCVCCCDRLCRCALHSGGLLAAAYLRAS